MGYIRNFLGLFLLISNDDGMKGDYIYYRKCYFIFLAKFL